MEYLLKASAVIALFYICFYFFLKRETFFDQNRWFLLIGIITGLIFPLIIIPVHINVQPESLVNTFYTLNENDLIYTAPEIVETQFDWILLSQVIYTLGLLFFIVQFFFQFGSLILLLLNNPKHKTDRYTYIIVNSKISPFSFFKWIVYNPDAFSKNELQLMLTHEKVHASEMHSLDILFTQLSCAIFWFNPLIWLYRKEVKQNLEYIADFKTQYISKNEQTYQRLLLKASIVNQNISLSNNFYNSSIKERIVMLKKSRSNTKKQWRYLLVLPILGLLLISMNTEEIYIETNSNEEQIQNSTTLTDADKQQKLKIVFNNTMNDNELDDIKKELKSNNIEMTLNRIKRNSKNQIIAIDIDFKTENGSTNYNVKDNKGINPFYFSLSEDGSFGVGAHKESATVIVKSLNKNNDTNGTVYIFSEVVKDSIEIAEGSLHKQLKHAKTKIIRFNQGDSTAVTATYSADFINDSLVLFKNSNIDTTLVTRYFKTKGNINANENSAKISGRKLSLLEPVNYSINNTNIQFMKNGQPLIVINGEVIKGISLNDLNSDDIESMNILKGNAALQNYGVKGKNGAVVITMKEDKKTQSPTKTWLSKTNENSPFLYIVNGKRISRDSFGDIKPDDIDSVTVLRDEAAIKAFGKEAKNGVILINTKVNTKFSSTKSSTKKEGPWKIGRAEVSSVFYVDDEDSSKNGSLAYITKFTSDKVIDRHKYNLEKIGLKVKISKVRRNKKNEITSIKISVKNENGDESSASFKNDKGISGIEFGLSQEALVVRSSKMNKDR